MVLYMGIFVCPITYTPLLLEGIGVAFDREKHDYYTSA